MNNHRLLAGLLAAALLGTGVCVAATPGRVVTLEELFESAESHSLQLRPSLTAESEARREIAVARAGRLPDIEASLSLSYIGDGFTTRRDFTDCQRAPIPHLGNGVGLTVTQPVYTGGAVTAAIEMAELKSSAARYAAELQRADIRFRLTGLYLDLYKMGGLREVTVSNTDRARKVLAEMTARHAQGVALHNDITRYELLVADLELSLTRIDNTMAILQRELAVTAGLPEGTVIIPDTTILARALPPAAGESDWQSEAAASSPALRLARSAADISRKAEAITAAERLPHVGLKAGWSFDGPILTEVPPIDRNLSYWYVGVGVSYNLSSLFKTDKALTRSRIATRRAREELAAAEERVSLDVAADYIRYREAYEALATRAKSVELAERNYHTIATRYSADMALITDMLDAANARLDAERRLVDARIDIIYYYYKLLFTSGKI